VVFLMMCEDKFEMRVEKVLMKIPTHFSLFWLETISSQIKFNGQRCFGNKVITDNVFFCLGKN
jgi:hypothetical protein